MFINELKNQSILVTGASDGIGREIARLLMENGARVAIHFNSNKKAALELLEEFGSTGSEIFQADLEDMGNCIQLWEQVLHEFGRLDSIVLNAGVYLEHAIEEEDQRH